MMRAEMDTAEAAWNAMQAAIASANAIAADCGEKMLFILGAQPTERVAFVTKALPPI